MVVTGAPLESYPISYIFVECFIYI